jgi:hypothetical protein
VWFDFTKSRGRESMRLDLKSAHLLYVGEGDIRILQVSSLVVVAGFAE